MKASYFKNNAYILRLLWHMKKGRILGELLDIGLGYIRWIFFDIIFIKYLVESMEIGRDFREIMFFLVAVSLVFALPSLFSKWYQHVYKPKADADIFEQVNSMLFQKATQVELECYENTEYYNRFTLAMKDCEQRFTQICTNLCTIFTSLIGSIFSLYYMFSIDPFVIVFIAGPIIGNFVFGKMINETNFNMKKESVPYIRKIDYVNRTIYLVDYAKELRISNVFLVLRKIYMEGFQGVLDKLKSYRTKRVSLKFIRDIFTFVIIFQGVMIYSLYRTLVTGSMTLSGFTVLFSAMTTAAWIVIDTSKAVIKSYEDSLYIANLKEFLEYTPTINEKQDGKTPELCVEGQTLLQFQNVSFTYKGQTQPTLHQVSLSLHRGEKIAIVGHNGAGKTTFIKLLMRLYDVSDGRILLNGDDVKELNLQAYRKFYGTAFQDYQVFSLSVAENVLMHKPENEADYAKVKEALCRTGVYEKVCTLPHGMDTILTKEFAQDGAVLSGGEIQKIAVARAFAKEYEIAVFDEPSSALDPIAEYKLYENILEMCREKTVIFISHRLSTAVLADTIYLFENGEIAESGSHDELMSLNGKYADMFRKQAQNYQRPV